MKLSRVTQRRWGWIQFALSACALPLAAQEVTVSPVQWVVTKGAPDELPVVKGKPRFEFPEGMRGTPDIGYVAVELVLDPKGRSLGMWRSATTPALVRVFQQDYEQLKFSPAVRDGKGVNSAVTLAVLFNPASANEKAADATPRLLEVAPARLPVPKGAKPDASFEDRVVYADVAVDETGSVTAVKNGPPELAEALTIAAKNWRFAPARKAGQPVAAELRAPFIVVTGLTMRGNGKGVLPVPKFQARPIYPFAMRASGFRGEVLVDFIVDIEGRVRNAFVARTLNPTFDEPALEAVRKWRFEPGRTGDVPVPTHMQVPIVFQLDERGGGDDGVQITKKPDLSKLPEELRYDTPPKLSAMQRPVFPYAQLSASHEGKAVVKFLIGVNGRVIKADVTEASAPEYGQALLAAVEQFTYEPALKGGRPCMALMSFSQEFSRDEGYQLLSADDLDALHHEQKKPQTIATLRDLDTKLAAISQRPLKYPLSQLEKSDRGEALVEFLVDEEGRVRLPRIVSATNDAFGYAAVQGVAAWRFEPPKRGGRATLVRVRAPIVFNVGDGAGKKP